MSLLQQSGRQGWENVWESENYEDDDENDEGSDDKNKELELFGTSFSHGPAKAQAQILKLKTPHILCIHDENCLTPFLHQQNLLRLHATHMGVAVWNCYIYYTLVRMLRKFSRIFNSLLIQKKHEIGSVTWYTSNCFQKPRRKLLPVWCTY